MASEINSVKSIKFLYTKIINFTLKDFISHEYLSKTFKPLN